MPALSLLDNLLFFILVTEGFITVVLLVPFGNAAKTSVITSLGKMENASLTYFARVVLAVITFLFVGNCYTAVQLGGAGAVLTDGMQMYVSPSFLDSNTV
jgi:hypothetical protein